jgi:hypothetical protein
MMAMVPKIAAVVMRLLAGWLIIQVQSNKI